MNMKGGLKNKDNNNKRCNVLHVANTIVYVIIRVQDDAVLLLSFFLLLITTFWFPSLIIALAH